MTTPNYDINYNDKRFADVKSAEKAANDELDALYGTKDEHGNYTGGIIGGADAFYQDQIQATKQWEIEQKKQQNAQTDFAISEIKQNKENARKDYLKEQSGAYADWQKQSNQYGANAEQMAAQGMVGTGYAESSQVSMYNTYQNRVATARESFQRAVQGYDNAITQARLQNSAALAKIAYETLQKTLELSLQGFQYKNQLISDLVDKKTAIRQEYHTYYQDVLDQINEENKLKETVRQYDTTHAETKRHNEAIEAAQAAQLQLDKDKLAEEVRQFDILHPQNTGGSGDSGGGGGGGGDGGKIDDSKKGGGKKSGGGISNLDGTKKTVSGSFTGSTYDAAVDYMKSKGVSSSDASGVMTKTEWSRRKNNYSYSTYAEYLKAYTQYAVQNLTK